MIKMIVIIIGMMMVMILMVTVMVVMIINDAKSYNKTYNFISRGYVNFSFQ